MVARVRNPPPPSPPPKKNLLKKLRLNGYIRRSAHRFENGSDKAVSPESDIRVKGSSLWKACSQAKKIQTFIFLFVSGKPELTNGLPEAEAVRHHFSDFLSFGTLQYEQFHKDKFCYLYTFKGFVQCLEKVLIFAKQFCRPEKSLEKW